MRALICAFGLVAAQTTQSGCTCKSYSEVRWRSPSGSMEGGFSHSGCGVGPFENYGPGKGRNWCDTVQTSCNNGQGWDLCIRSSAPPMPPVRAEQVNVNQAWSTASIQTSTKGSGVNLHVNVNVKGGSSGSTTITTVRGCTCHPTSEVIVLQNGVRVGGGFSHTGCGTGPYEANSPGKGSPWCDTVETWCSDGWDLCVPPNSPQQNSYTPPQSQNLVSSTNSYTSYSNTGTYQQFFPPSPSSQIRYTSQPQQPSAYIVQQSKSSQNPFSPPKNSRQSGSKSHRSSSRGNFDYDYDVPSSTSNLLPLMLLSGSSSSTTNNNLLPFMLATQSSGSNNNNLLPLMLASQGSGSTDNMLPLMLATQGGGSSSSMLPMMMMMGSGSLGSSNTMAQFAMLNAFREGDGQAQDLDKLGQAGESLGFTRAVVVTSSAETDVDDSTQSPDVAGIEQMS
jgi:hypothetical protein